MRTYAQIFDGPCKGSHPLTSDIDIAAITGQYRPDCIRWTSSRRRVVFYRIDCSLTPKQSDESMAEKFLIERTATNRTDGSAAVSRKLSDWRHLDAYVLLGEPGSGKSTAFVEEAKAMGLSAVFTTVRQLVTLGPPKNWCGEVLFIDALDERRSVTMSRKRPANTP